MPFIVVTRLREGNEEAYNSDDIHHIEKDADGDTLIQMKNGERIWARETVQQLVEAINA